jgi:hypothetical protein
MKRFLVIVRLPIVVITLLLAGCSAPAAPAVETPTVSEPGAQLVGVEEMPLDTPAQYCVFESERLAVFTLDRGNRFSALFPRAGEGPELDSVAVPVLVVVYANGWPGLARRLSGVTPSPDTWDVCVETLDGRIVADFGAPFIVYGDIPREGSPLVGPP